MPIIEVFSYVNDVTLKRVATTRLLVQQLSAAVPLFLRVIEEDLRLRVSNTQGQRKGKSAYLTSTAEVAEALRPVMGGNGLEHKEFVSWLGVDY